MPGSLLVSYHVTCQVPFQAEWKTSTINETELGKSCRYWKVLPTMWWEFRGPHAFETQQLYCNCTAQRHRTAIVLFWLWLLGFWSPEKSVISELVWGFLQSISKTQTHWAQCSEHKALFQNHLHEKKAVGKEHQRLAYLYIYPGTVWLRRTLTLAQSIRHKPL